MKRDRPTSRLAPELVWPGKQRAGDRAARATASLVLREVAGHAYAGAGGFKNKLVLGDNRRVVPALLGELAGKVDLVYIDPPFATGGDFSLTRRAGGGEKEVLAYTDRWDAGLGEYLSTMLEQLELLRALLSERGTIFVHCDWHVSHHMRCVLDEVFGPDAFLNEIVWRYRRWPAKTRAFQRMHDVLFWYAASPGDLHAWTPLYEQLAASTLETFGTKRQVADFSSGRRKPSQTEDETPGAPMSDVWDIGIIAPIAHERVGYPTQKPEALLRRVIEAASRPGDLVADFFCGSGTTLVAAEKLGRRWIGCDASPAAIHAARKRLLGLSAVREGEALERGCSEVEIFADAETESATDVGVTVTRDGAGSHAVEVRLDDGEGIDFWAVDWDHDGGVFRHRWHTTRERRGGKLPMVAAHAYPKGGRYRIAVQAIGADGRERRRVLEWQAK